MYLARSADDKRIQATRDENGYCPSCRGQLTPRMGEINEWHWSHKPGQACSYRKSGSFWQYRWIAHYHATGEWEMETDLDGVSFDGIHWDKRISLLLSHKLDAISVKSFIEASAQHDLKPLIIFNPRAFDRFQFSDYLLKHPRRSDTSWILFFTHAFTGHNRSASFWLDINQDEQPHFGLMSGIYNLSYSADGHGAITVGRSPRLRSRLQPAADSADSMD